jgi:CheY-like chemotaxis protein
MTADAFEDDIHRCLDAGMTGHVAKPIDPKTLFEVLRETVRRARPAGETEK